MCGSMFSGKTEELIRRVRRAQIARQKLQIFKPSIDTRYDSEDVVSHSSLAIKSQPVNRAVDILLNLRDSTRIVAIDEVQFFDEEIVSVANKLANQGKRVIVAGLDMDFSGKAFGPIPGLMAVAEYVTKVHAVCTRTGLLPANRWTKRWLILCARFKMATSPAFSPNGRIGITLPPKSVVV